MSSAAESDQRQWWALPGHPHVGTVAASRPMLQEERGSSCAVAYRTLDRQARRRSPPSPTHRRSCRALGLTLWHARQRAASASVRSRTPRSGSRAGSASRRERAVALRGEDCCIGPAIRRATHSSHALTATGVLLRLASRRARGASTIRCRCPPDSSGVSKSSDAISRARSSPATLAHTDARLLAVSTPWIGRP